MSGQGMEATIATAGMPTWMLQAYAQAPGPVASAQMVQSMPDGSRGMKQVHMPVQMTLPQNFLGPGQAAAAYAPMALEGQNGASGQVLVVYNPQTQMYFQQSPSGMLPFAPAVDPTPAAMRPQDINSLVSGMCRATGMSPALLYNYLGASLAASNTSPGFAYPGILAQNRQGLPAPMAVAQSESDANSCPQAGSTQNSSIPAPAVQQNTQGIAADKHQVSASGTADHLAAGSTGNVLVAAKPGEERAGVNMGTVHSSTQVSEASNQKPPESPAGNFIQWQGPAEGTAEQTNARSALSPPASELDHLGIPSILNHSPPRSNMWSTSPSLSPLLSAKLPVFNSPFGSLERFGSSSPPTLDYCSTEQSPATLDLCSAEREPLPVGLLQGDRGGGFTLAEIFAEMGDASSPIQYLSLGSLAAANQGAGAPAGANEVGEPASTANQETTGGTPPAMPPVQLNPRGGLADASGKVLGVQLAGSGCDDLASSASMPGERDDGKATGGDGAESAVSPLSMQWSEGPTTSGSHCLQQLSGPSPNLADFLLRSGSDISTFSMGQEAVASHTQSPLANVNLGQLPSSHFFVPARDIAVPPITGHEGFQAASWQAPEEAPVSIDCGNDSWPMQVDDVCSPAVTNPPRPSSHLAFREPEERAPQKVGANRCEPNKRKPKQATDAQAATDKANNARSKKRVRNTKAKVPPGTANNQTGGAAVETVNTVQVPESAMAQPPSHVPPPHQPLIATSATGPAAASATPAGSHNSVVAGGNDKGDAGVVPLQEGEAQAGRRRPEIQAILRLAQSQAAALGPSAGEGKDAKKKSPEEILRGAFQASMAAKAKEDGKTGRKGPCTEPQALAARARRERVNARMRVLQSLVPGAAHLTTENFLLEAVQYVTSLIDQATDLTEARTSDECYHQGAESLPSGKNWGWPYEPELFKRGLCIVPVNAVSAIATEGGVLDVLLQDQGLIVDFDMENINAGVEMDDLEAF